MPSIWTIGHSTRSLIEIIDMLKENDINMLIDVRSYPGSRKYPHFNKENLIHSIPSSGIEYAHIVDLGGRRKNNKNSKNTDWKHPSFRGYADYMETTPFENGIQRLEVIAKACKVCYMCSEAVWWKCHRSMISDYLLSRGWSVWHIMGMSVRGLLNVKPHKYTKPAKILNGLLIYHSMDQLDFNFLGQ